MQKISLIGNLGKDIEERYTSNGNRMFTFSLAVNTYKNVTVWYEAVIWENKIPAFEKIIPYLKKGSRIYIDGELLPPDTYQKKDGSVHVKLALEPSYITFAGSPQKKEEETTSVFNDQNEIELPF